MPKKMIDPALAMTYVMLGIDYITSSASTICKLACKNTLNM